jgi:hypothetical protein
MPVGGFRARIASVISQLAMDASEWPRPSSCSTLRAASGESRRCAISAMIE